MQRRPGVTYICNGLCYRRETSSTVNSTILWWSINLISAQVFVWTFASISLRLRPRSRSAGSRGRCMYKYPWRQSGTKAGSASACKTCTNLRDQLDGIQCLIKHIHYYQKHYCLRPALDKLLGHLFIPGKESRILKGCYFLPASIPLSLKHHSNGRYPFWVENKTF